MSNYINKMLEWGVRSPADVGKNIWAIISKSDHDRAVLEHMMRFHPDYYDPAVIDGRGLSQEDVYAKFGRIVLNGVV